MRTSVLAALLPATVATLTLSLGILTRTPKPAGALVVATPAPCPTFATGLVAFGIDPTQPVTVEQSQSFMLAMRGGGGESFLSPYQMRVTPAGPIVTYVRAFTISDVTFTNSDNADSASSTPSPAASATTLPSGKRVIHEAIQIHTPAPVSYADGPATQYFLFTATGIGTTTVTFDEFQIGNTTTPYATKTYTIVVKGPLLIC